MTRINLKINISLNFENLSEESYREITHFLALTDSDIPLDNKEVIELLALDKRPIFVSRKAIDPRSNEFIRNAEIDLIC